MIRMENKKFNKLFVLSFAGINNRRMALWNCLCECGTKVIISGTNLRKNRAKSCGCLKKERTALLNKSGDNNRKHGLYKSSTYKSWSSMIGRCTNKNNSSFNDYGARGIRVCQQWLSDFRFFLKDMGKRPDGTSLDRIDVDGNYEPNNCRWATAKEQANNKRKLMVGKSIEYSDHFVFN